MFHSPFTLSSSGLAICVKSNTRFVFLFPGDKSYCLKLKLKKKKKNETKNWPNKTNQQNPHQNNSQEIKQRP